MADPLRNDIAAPGPPIKDAGLNAPNVDELLIGFPADRALPQADNPRLNRTAESIGSALGTAVGRMRNGLSLVQYRGREVTRQVSDTVSEKSGTISATVLERVGQVGDIAEDRAARLLDAAGQRWNAIRRDSGAQIEEWRRRSLAYRDEYPLQAIGAFAAAGFLAGFIIRVWRSTND